MLTAGVDIGSLTTKALIFDGSEIKDYIILNSGHLLRKQGIKPFLRSWKNAIYLKPI